MAFVLFFIFPPVLTLIPTLGLVYKQKKIGYVLLALWCGLFAMSLPPGGDVYHYQMLHYRLADGTEDIQRYINYDFIFQSVLYLFAKCDIPFALFRFFCVSTIYCSVFNIYRRAYVKNPSLKDNRGMCFFSFCLMFLSVSFIQSISGMRYMLGVSVMATGVYVLLEDKKLIKGFLLLIIACFIHFSLVLFLAITAMSYIVPKKINGLVAAALILVGIFSGLVSDVMTSLLESSSDVNYSYFSGYVSGKWVEDFMTEASLAYQFYRWLTIIAVFVLVVYLLRFGSEKNFRWSRYLLCCAIITSFFFFSKAIFLRYSFFLQVVFCIFIAQYANFRIRNSFWHILLAFATLAMSFSCDIYGCLRPKHIRMSHVDQMLYMPSAMILTTNYDRQWLELYRMTSGAAIWDE